MEEVKVALLGLGNVGRALASYISGEKAATSLRISISAVADSTGGIFINDAKQIPALVSDKEAGRSIREFAPADTIKDIAEFVKSLPVAGVSVLIESLPTNILNGQPALDLIKSALAQGTGVVTVNKGPLAHGFDQLMGAARTGRSQLGYSGTTGVSIPGEVSGAQVLEIRGVLNGTTNYILTQIEERSVTFEQALKEAQGAGIAEPDPSLDIEGWDTASKILILAKALMRADARLSDVSRIGIGAETEALFQAARRRGGTVRLIGRARVWQGRVRVSVAPKIVTAESPFYSVRGTSKAAIFKTADRGEVMSFARSGRNAISQIIVDDIKKIVRRQ